MRRRPHQESRINRFHAAVTSRRAGPAGPVLRGVRGVAVAPGSGDTRRRCRAGCRSDCRTRSAARRGTSGRSHRTRTGPRRWAVATGAMPVPPRAGGGAGGSHAGGKSASRKGDRAGCSRKSCRTRRRSGGGARGNWRLRRDTRRDRRGGRLSSPSTQGRLERDRRGYSRPAGSS